jgi:hypothetical protein
MLIKGVFWLPFVVYMGNSSSSSSSGIGFAELLTIVFIVLKLTETTVVATWS